MARVKTSRSSKKTVLAFGQVTTAVSLYKSSGDPEDIKRGTFVKAGPTGAPLEKAAAQNGKRHEEAVASRTGEAQKAADVLEEQDTSPLKPSAPVDAIPETAPVTIETFEVGGEKPLNEETDIRRGVRLPDSDGNDEFIDLTKALDYIDETTQLEEMRITGFVERRNVKTEQIVGSYFLGVDVAGGGAPKVLALLWHAMRAESRVAVVKWTKGTSQSLGVIVPQANGALLVVELLWDAQIREPGKAALLHAAETVTKGEVAAASDLIKAMSHSPELLREQVDDRYRMQANLLILAQEGRADEFEVPDSKPERAGNGDDILALLNESRAQLV